MKLNTITNGNWTDIANYLNYNFNKMGIAVSQLGDSLTPEGYPYKGVFQTEAELFNKFPEPLLGDYAFVLVTTDPEDVFFQVYLCDNYVWEKTDGTYDPQAILENYIETVEIDSLDDIMADVQEYNNLLGNAN